MPSGLGLTVQVWSSTDLRPLGQPVVAAGVPVGLVTEGRKLFLIGIDPATGRQLWKQEASPSAVTPGIPVSVDVIGDRVVYFRPDAAGELYARLVVADPKTGNDLVASGPQLFVSRPTACSRRPDDRDVCTVATASRSQTPRSHRLKVDTGQYVAEDTTVAAYTRSIGDGGLVDLGPRGPEYLAMIRDGNVAWRTPVTQAFPSGFSTDHGWNWRYRSEEHAFIGSIYGPTTQLPDGSRRRDLASGAAMAALSETDGSVLWRDNGSSIDCDGTVSVSVPVRCRYRGSATYRTDRPASYEGLDVTIEGYDRRSRCHDLVGAGRSRRCPRRRRLDRPPHRGRDPGRRPGASRAGRYRPEHGNPSGGRRQRRVLVRERAAGVRVRNAIRLPGRPDGNDP